MGVFPSWDQQLDARESSQPLLNVCISFAILETFFVIAFMFSWHFNGKSNRNSKVVYLFILIGYLFCFGGVVLGILKITLGGAGYHANTLPPSTLQNMLQLVKAHEFVYVSSILFPKLAILVLYLRLFTFKYSRYVIYLTGIIVICTFLFGIVASVANCRPFSAFWSLQKRPKCTMDVMIAFRYYSIPNITADVLVLALPLSVLRKLQVSRMTKIGVYLTFLTMAFGIVTAVLRFVSFLDIDLFKDVTYNCISTTSWTIIEPGVYLIAATMPTLRPLIRRIVRETDWFRCRNHKMNRTNAGTSRARISRVSAVSEKAIAKPARVLKKKSSRSLQLEAFDTIGQRPSRAIVLDDYHHLQEREAPRSLRSMDEESMVCADALIYETMGKLGAYRNPDGTLRGWSLQPVQLSPLRTSFFETKSNRSSAH